MAIALRKTFNVKVGVPGASGDQLHIFIYELDFDSSYPAGGEALDLTADIKNVLAVFAEGKAGYEFSYDYANKKLKAFFGDYSASADGPHSEVNDTGNLSSVTGVRLLALGY